MLTAYSRIFLSINILCTTWEARMIRWRKHRLGCSTLLIIVGNFHGLNTLVVVFSCMRRSLWVNDALKPLSIIINLAPARGYVTFEWTGDIIVSLLFSTPSLSFIFFKDASVFKLAGLLECPFSFKFVIGKGAYILSATTVCQRSIRFLVLYILAYKYISVYICDGKFAFFQTIFEVASVDIVLIVPVLYSKYTFALLDSLWEISFVVITIFIIIHALTFELIVFEVSIVSITVVKILVTESISFIIPRYWTNIALLIYYNGWFHHRFTYLARLFHFLYVVCWRGLKWIHSNITL